MTNCQDTESVAVHLSKFTDATKTLFPSAIRDIKEVNRVLLRVVDSDAETLNTTGDTRVSFKVNNFKQTITESLITSESFSQATESVATYASDDVVLQGIKEELSNPHEIQHTEKLTSYLNVLRERLINCRECLTEIQTRYSNLSRLALEHKRRISHTRLPLSQLFVLSLTPVAVRAVSGFVGTLTGFIFGKTLVSLIKPSSPPPLPVAANYSPDSMKEPQRYPPVPHLQGTTMSSYFIYEYVLPLLLGVVVGIGFFYLAKKFRFYHRLGTYASFTEQGVSMLQSVENSIANFESKIEVTTHRLCDLEHCLSKASDCVSALDRDAETDADKTKTQQLLDKIQHEMSVLHI